MNKLHKLLIITLLLIMDGNALKAENLTATRNSETELVTKNQDLHSHDNLITNDNHVASTLRASAAYNGTPVTPTKIDESNYQQLGLTEENWSTYNGYYAIRNASELYGFADLVNGGNRSVNGVLLQDIVVNTSVSASGAAYSWIPIGATEETQVWGQNIDNGEMADAYPVLGGAKVYKHTFDFGKVYSNLETLEDVVLYEGKCGDNLIWTLDSNCTLTISGTGEMYDYSHSGDQVSPWKNINPKPTSLILEEGMTSIGEYAFYNCSTLSGNLIFPSTITNIGKYAFYNCNKLSGDLTIPNSVTSIGKTAFYGCSGLDGVLTISNNITAINEETFTNCYNLTGDLIIPDGVTYIGKKAFYNCNKLSGNLIIPSGVTSIETDTFYRCYALSGNLTIPGNVVSIGTYAFQDCDGFTSLTIEEGVQTIAGSAFYGCSGMKGDLRIPNSVTSIGSRAFYSCGLDGELIISHCITSIGDFVFYGTKFSNLVFEDLPDKKSQLTSIGSSAFYMCSSLNNELIIPNSVTSIGISAFNGCTKLTSIFMYRESALDIGTNAFNKTNSATIYAPVIWSSFDNIPETQLVKMPTYTSQQVNETTSQQVWVGLAEGQTEPGENEHVAINAPLVLGQQTTDNRQQTLSTLTVKSFGYCGDGTTTNGSITIEEGGHLYCETARGEVTVRKEIIGYAGQQTSWYTIASPLKDVTSTSSVSGLLTTESDYDLYRYDEPTYIWQNAKPGEGSTNFQTIEPGRGYLYANAENTTLEFTGNINTEDVNYTLTAQSEVLNGFHLVGNPYTHDISFNHLSADAELANGYYVLNGEGAWGATLGNEGDVIKVGQGALIKTTSDGTLRISKSQSRSDAESQSRDASMNPAKSTNIDTSQQPTISLTVSNSTYSDKAFVVFDKGVGLDKINHENENIPLLYIPQDGTDYAIAMMDDNVNEIPVNFEAKTMGQYTISLQQENCEFEELYLLDKETGNKVNILEESYTFMAKSNDNPERFVLLKANSQQQTANSDFAYISGSDLIINAGGAVQIIDMMGRVVYSIDVTSDSSRINVSGFDNAAYIVRVVNEEGVKVQKVIVY